MFFLGGRLYIPVEIRKNVEIWYLLTIDIKLVLTSCLHLVFQVWRLKSTFWSMHAWVAKFKYSIKNTKFIHSYNSKSMYYWHVACSVQEYNDEIRTPSGVKSGSDRQSDRSIVRQSYRQHEYDMCGISKFV